MNLIVVIISFVLRHLVPEMEHHKNAKFNFLDLPESQKMEKHLTILRHTDVKTTKHLPVIMWHGMGDYYDSNSMKWAAESMLKAQPDLEIFSIYIDEDSKKDRSASVWGDAMSEVTQACNEIKSLQIDINNGINLVGFSQGGLFVRALAQVCDVKVNNVIAIGSPQNGFADLPPCEPDNSFCKRRNEFLKSRMYTDFMQNNNIQAQYFRDVNNFETYLEKSVFLKFINNELYTNVDYKKKMKDINKLVLIMFQKDETLVPKETAWFYDLDPESGKLIHFNHTTSYKYNLIGLKTLNEQGKIDFLSIDNLHLVMTEEDMMFLADTYL
ncbi:hypothetical protein CAS74_004882 [Pichia kudriavzevii]|uniref:Palmitoyl-protein thioesterase 1 n=1 Tax=Pichia kudriavzevii TaxID=4909 RepID=A0A1Z8JHU2_PICKU|nr:hypothetical protein CAS74_004882 [Pichia kudriavzevii]